MNMHEEISGENEIFRDTDPWGFHTDPWGCNFDKHIFSNGLVKKPLVLGIYTLEKLPWNLKITQLKRKLI